MKKTAKETIFRSTEEAKNHAAMNVALSWLKFAERVISRGDRPARLSDCGYDLSRAELDRDLYRPFRLSVSEVRATAIKYALIHLNNGLFLSVREYFSAKKACSETCSECGAKSGDPRYLISPVRIQGGLCQDCRWYQNK